MYNENPFLEGKGGTWAGPFDKIWTPVPLLPLHLQCHPLQSFNSLQQCSYLESFNSPTLESCQQECLRSVRCNAITYDKSKSKPCFIVRCPYAPHIPEPIVYKDQLARPLGYCVQRKVSPQCLKKWDNICNFEKEI